MSTVKKLAGQTAIYGLSTILGRFINYLLVPLYTRVFSNGEYGVNTEFYGYIAFLTILLTHGMETAFFRFANKDNGKQVFANAAWSVLTVSTGFAVLFLGFGQTIADAIGYGDHPEYIYYSVGILFFDGLNAIPFAWLRSNNKALRFALVRNANILLNIALNLYLLLLAPYVFKNYQVKLWLYQEDQGINAIFLANLIAAFVTVILLSKELSMLRNGFQQVQWKQMLTYAAPMVLVGMAGMVNETFSRTMFRYIWPDEEQAKAMNGIFAANYKLSILITLFIQAYKYAAEPFFFNHAKTTEKRDLYARVMNYFLLICLAAFLLVELFIDYFKLFIGPDFREGLKVVPILLWANIFLGVYYNLSIWYKLADQTGKGAVIAVLGALITIGLNLWLIPSMGYMGCAWATFVCYLFMMVMGYVWGQKYYPIPYELGRALTYTLLTIALWLMASYSSVLITPTGFAGIVLRIFFLGIFMLTGFVLERKQGLAFFKK